MPCSALPTFTASDECAATGGFMDVPELFPSVLTYLPQTRRLARALPADFDGDGDTDLVTSYDRFVVFHENLGGRAFALGRLLSSRSSAPAAVAVADFDADGRPDWLHAQSQTNELSGHLELHLRSSSGQFRVTRTVGPTFDLALAAEDLDGEGEPDFLVTVEGAYAVVRSLGDLTFELVAHESAVGPDPKVADVADVDADGLPDVLLTEDRMHEVYFLHGLGAGRFAPKVLLALADTPELPDVPGGGARFVDVNGDGLLDVVLHHTSIGMPAWIRGLGGGDFGDEALLDPTGVRSIAFADLDADGDSDQLRFSDGVGESLGENSGGGVMRDAGPLPWGDGDFVLFDADDDSLPDIVRMSATGPLTIRRGLGGFQFEAPPEPERRLVTAGKIAVGDLDANGLEDVVFVGSGGETHGLVQLAPGRFERRWEWPQPSVSSLAGTGDANADGLTDLFWGGASGVVVNPLYVTENLGGERFAEPTLLAEGFRASEAILTDVDGDGRTDVVLRGADGTNVWFSTTEPEVARPLGDPAAQFELQLLVDVNGDTLPDLVARSFVHQPSVRVQLNLGGGLFEDVDSAAGIAGARTIALARDLDGDGRVDLVGTNLTHETLWYRPNAAGGFTAAPLATNLQLDDAADLDADGDVDLLLSVAGTRIAAVNEGDGRFVAAHLPIRVMDARVEDLDGDGTDDVLTPPDGGWFRGPVIAATHVRRVPGVPGGGPIQIADLDADGHLDVVAGDAGGHLLTARGLGDGSFERPVMENALQPGGRAEELHIFDADLDTHPDVIVRDDRAGWLVYANDGLGRFPGPPVPLVDGRPSAHLLVGDLNGDAIADFVLCTDGTEPAVVIGTGELPLDRYSVFDVRAQNSESCVLGDFDGDGDLDLVVSTSLLELATNDGQGHLRYERRLSDFPAAGPILAADVDRDGRQDLVFRVSALRNPGVAGVWRTMDQRPFPAAERFWAGQLTGDAQVEFVTLQNNGLTFHEQRPDGAWSQRGSIQPVLQPAVEIAFGDLNEDGLPDAVISEPGQSGLVIRLQRPACPPDSPPP
jgi:hypothetical protein